MAKQIKLLPKRKGFWHKVFLAFMERPWLSISMFVLGIALLVSTIFINIFLAGTLAAKIIVPIFAAFGSYLGMSPCLHVITNDYSKVKTIDDGKVTKMFTNELESIGLKAKQAMGTIYNITPDEGDSKLDFRSLKNNIHAIYVYKRKLLKRINKCKTTDISELQVIFNNIHTSRNALKLNNKNSNNHVNVREISPQIERIKQDIFKSYDDLRRFKKRELPESSPITNRREIAI